MDNFLIFCIYLIGVFLAIPFAKAFNSSFVAKKNYINKIPAINIIFSFALVISTIIVYCIVFLIDSIFLKDGLIRKLYSKLDNWIQNANS